MSAVSGFETKLDRFLPANGQKCDLFKCTPGKIWAVLAVLSLLGSINRGWKAVLMTALWQGVVGLGIAWLCRGCAYGWLWALLIIFAGIPLALILLAGGLIWKVSKAADNKTTPPPCNGSGCSA